MLGNLKTAGFNYRENRSEIQLKEYIIRARSKISCVIEQSSKSPRTKGATTLGSAEKGRVSERLTERLTIFKFLQAIEYLPYKKKNINGVCAGNFLSFSATRSLAGDTDVAQYLWAQKPASRQAVPVATTIRALGHMSYDKSSGLDVLELGPGTGMLISLNGRN